MSGTAQEEGASGVMGQDEKPKFINIRKNCLKFVLSITSTEVVSSRSLEGFSQGAGQGSAGLLESRISKLFLSKQ